MDAGDTIPWRESVESSLERRPRVTPGAVTENLVYPFLRSLLFNFLKEIPINSGFPAAYGCAIICNYCKRGNTGIKAFLTIRFINRDTYYVLPHEIYFDWIISVFLPGCLRASTGTGFHGRWNQEPRAERNP